MPIAPKDQSIILTEAISTKAAADVLASQTRAFGNAAAKLSLQMATEKFLRAKEAFLEKAAANDKTAEEAK